VKALAILAAVVGLSACSSTGGFVSPAEMTPMERCQNAEIILALMETNGVGPETLARARANVDLLCKDVGL
jgi:hypothetical protein